MTIACDLDMEIVLKKESINQTQTIVTLHSLSPPNLLIGRPPNLKCLHSIEDVGECVYFKVFYDAIPTRRPRLSRGMEKEKKG